MPGAGGAGMGMNCAGEIADLAFVSDRERPFLLDCLGDVTLDAQRSYGIKMYKRFKDDGLAIVRASNQQIIDFFMLWNTISEWRVDKICIARRGSPHRVENVMTDRGGT